MKTNIFLVHDGINNSVFYSQVLTTFKQQAINKPAEQFYICCFVYKVEQLNYALPGNMQIILLQKSHFQTINIIRFKKFLKNKRGIFIIARNAISGFIAQKSNCKNILVQARGILTEEYEMAHQNQQNKFKKIYNYFRKQYYRHIERTVYSNQNYKVEAVSNAMKIFLNQMYGTPLINISIAKLDIPKPIEPAKLTEWKNEVRTNLGIENSKYVICYSGSVQAWQHPKDIIPFLKAILNEKQNIFLLILTTDVEEFKKYLYKENINEVDYKLLNVKPDQMPKYLAACDAGVIYRQEHIVNWVCRPTKALEYKACNLKIIHNKTVDFLINEI